MADKSSNPALSRFERAALSLFRFTNETAAVKRAQTLFHDNFTRHWVRFVIGNRIFVDGIENMLELDPDRGVLLCANHRSFFDMYISMLTLFEQKTPWLERIYFPVRSNFFYERAAGVFLNAAVGGGAMYPPIFRDPAKSAFNDDALDRVARFLSERGTCVGMHPEGTRNKTDDPYTMLPAQPGVGQIVLRSRPIVVPMFILGVTNDFVGQVRLAQRPGSHITDPIILVYGEPLDYSEFTDKKPRLALYKRVADKINAAIADLARRERQLREQIANREHDGAPGWLRWRPVNGVV